MQGQERHWAAANTRSQNLINRVQSKVNASAATYTRARNALTKIIQCVREHLWRTKLLALAPEDIRPLKEGRLESWKGSEVIVDLESGGITEDSEDKGCQEG